MNPLPDLPDPSDPGTPAVPFGSGRTNGARPRGRAGLVLAVVLTLLAATHLVVVHVDASSPASPADRSPPLLEAAYGWWLALGVAAACVAIGRAFARLLGRRLEGPAGTAAAAAVGLTASTTLLLLLALAFGAPSRLDRGEAIAFGLLLLVPAASSVLRRRPTGLGAPRARARRVGRVLGAAAVQLLAAPYLAQTLLPDADWDAALYHLPLADRLREDALLTDALPLHAYYRPASIHLLYAALLEAGGGAAITPLNLVAIALALLAAGGIARQLAGRRAAPYGVAAAASASLLLELGLDARVDAFVALFAAAGAWALVRAAKRPSARLPVLVAAAALGGAAATKYNGLPVAGALFAVLLALVLVGRARRPRVPLRRKATLAAAALAFAVLPGGFFYARNHVLMGDAVYPFTHGARFVNRDGERVPLEGAFRAVPQRAKAPKRKAAYLSELKETSDPEERVKPSLTLLLDAVLDPERHESKPLHRASPFLLLFLLLPLVVRTRAAVALSAATLLAYALLATRSAELRYLAPLFPALAGGAGAVIARAPPRSGRVPAVLGLSLLLLSNAAEETAKARSLEPLRYLSGREDALSYLGRVGYNGEVHLPRLVKWLNDQVDRGRVAADARVYMLAEAKGHLLKLPYTPTLSNSFAEFFVELKNFRMRRGALARSLVERGYAFLLVNRGWVVWNVRHSAVDRPVLQATMHQLDLFLEAHASLVARQGDISLYRLKGTE